MLTRSPDYDANGLLPPEPRADAPERLAQVADELFTRLAWGSNGSHRAEGDGAGNQARETGSPPVDADRGDNLARLDRHQGQLRAGGAKINSAHSARSATMKQQRALLVAWAVSALLFGSGVVSAIVR